MICFGVGFGTPSLGYPKILPLGIAIIFGEATKLHVCILIFRSFSPLHHLNTIVIFPLIDLDQIPENTRFLCTHLAFENFSVPKNHYLKNHPEQGRDKSDSNCPPQPIMKVSQGYSIHNGETEHANRLDHSLCLLRNEK